MSHTCHAHDCEVDVPPAMFMCKPHWYSLCKPTRDAIWREYRPRQEVTKRPSLRYLAVQRFAVGEALARAGGSVKTASRYFEEGQTFRQRCIEGGLGDPFDETLLLVRDRLIPPPRVRRKHAS